MSVNYYAPKLPLQLGDNNDFVYISDVREQLKQKLKMLIYTNPGEKIMMPNFGVGIKKYLFESENGSIEYNTQGPYITSIKKTQISAKITEEITSQVTNYLPDVQIVDISTDIVEQVLYLSLTYTYRNILTDSIEMQVTI